MLYVSEKGQKNFWLPMEMIERLDAVAALVAQIEKAKEVNVSEIAEIGLRWLLSHKDGEIITKLQEQRNSALGEFAEQAAVKKVVLDQVDSEQGTPAKPQPRRADQRRKAGGTG